MSSHKNLRLTPAPKVGYNYLLIFVSLFSCSTCKHWQSSESPLLLSCIQGEEVWKQLSWKELPLSLLICSEAFHRSGFRLRRELLPKVWREGINSEENLVPGSLHLAACTWHLAKKIPDNWHLAKKTPPANMPFALIVSCVQHQLRLVDNLQCSINIQSLSSRLKLSNLSSNHSVSQQVTKSRQGPSWTKFFFPLVIMCKWARAISSCSLMARTTDSILSIPSVLSPPLDIALIKGRTITYLVSGRFPSGEAPVGRSGKAPGRQ